MQQKQERKDVKIINLFNEQTNEHQPYVLSLDLLGKGQFGTVYKAVHKMDKTKVYAVKAVQLKDDKARQQIQKELEIIQKLPESPNIIKIEKQQIQSEKNVYIFQEYCQGGSLQSFKQQNKSVLLSEQVIFDLFYQLTLGYLQLYKANIVHEDIKSSNIMIKGHLYKYCDFGVSELKDKVKESNCRNGTISYMAPDKLRLKYLPNASSDIFSLGVTIYQVVFGFHPYNIDHSVKDYKVYLREIRAAELRPAHQIIDKVKNASAMFYTFLQFLEKMIQRRQDSRAKIEELENFIKTHEPFKSMTPPVQYQQDQSQDIQQMIQSCNYNVIEQSAIHFVESKFNNVKHKSEKNRLLMKRRKQQQKQVNNEIDSAQQLSNSNNQDANNGKSKEQIEKQKEQQQIINEIRQALANQHKIIRSLTHYLNSGQKILLEEIFPQFQKKNKLCCRGFLTSIFQFITKSVNLQTQHQLSILHFLILKFNHLLFIELREYMRSYIQRIIQSSSQISTASESFLNYFHEVEKDIGYYEGQLNKFLVENQLENMKDIVQQVRQWDITKFCSILLKVYNSFFCHITQNHDIRCNFKYDILNGIFLVQVENILKQVKDFYQNVHSQIQLNQSEKANELQASSNQPANSRRAQEIYEAIKVYNECNKKKLKNLRPELGKQFNKYNKILLSSQEQNQDAFEDVDDELLIELGVNLEINDREEQIQRQRQMLRIESEKVKNL